MNMATIIAVAAIVLILFLAIRYVYKERKKGVQCIGCPYAESCQKAREAAGGNCGHSA